ncbi:TPA: TRAM domain-containing protein [Candidatus Woesearchaeota archaeon]|nr:TRAM domain-containing protein [Candidatus Woesearchaeota archaeon]
MNTEREVPVRVGDIHEVLIDSVGGKGDGVAKVRGFVIFVPNVKKGDYVKIKITKVLPSVGFAEVVEKLEKPAPRQRFATVSKEEMDQRQDVPDQHYEDTEDFGDEK